MDDSYWRHRAFKAEKELNEMKTRESMVARFFEASGEKPCSILDMANRAKTVRAASLIREEAIEFDEAVVQLLTKVVYGYPINAHDTEAVIKELADLQYTISNFALQFGIDLDDAFARVHRSNMTKINPLTQKPYEHRSADGKVLKGPHYVPPDLSDVAYDGKAA